MAVLIKTLLVLYMPLKLIKRKKTDIFLINLRLYTSLLSLRCELLPYSYSVARTVTSVPSSLDRDIVLGRI